MSLRYLGGIIKPSYNPLAANVTVSPTVVQTGGVYTIQQQAQAQGQQQWSHDPYFNNTTLLLHADNFANGSQNNTFLTTPPGGVGSYTGYFVRASSQYLTVSNAGGQFSFGTGAFTIECWISLKTLPSGTGYPAGYWLFGGGPVSSNPGIDFYINNTQIGFNLVDFTSPTAIGNHNMSAGLWYHVAVVRGGTSNQTLSIYVNGTRVATASSVTATADSATSGIAISAAEPSGATSGNFDGYISNYRIVKGSAVYDPSQATITVPASPLTAISGTSLLTCQSATFVDNSGNNLTITNNGTATIVNPNSFPVVTRNGTPTQGTFTPYGSRWSNYFNGVTGSYLQAPNGAAFQFPGDFTIDFWYYPTSYAIAATFFDGLTPGYFTGQRPTCFCFYADITTGYLKFYTNNVTTSSTVAPTLNQWNYISLQRSGSTITLYLNGSVALSLTNSTNFSNGYCTIGAFVASGDYGCPTGYLSDFRIVKGSALSPAVPSSPATAVSGTSLLTCQSNRFADASTNNFTITVTGTPSVQRFAPFSPSSGYSPSVYSGGGYFNGTTDYVTTPSSSALNFGTGDFTLEAWVYITDFSSNSTILDKRVTSGSAAPWVWYTDTAGKLNFYTGTNYITTSAFPKNAWTHVVTSRVSGTLYQFINGVSVFTPASVTANLDTTATLLIAVSNDSPGVYFKGYISDLRIVKGAGVTSVTVPSSPLTAITNTSLLLSYTNAGIYDNGMQNNLTTVSTAQVNTSIVKYGSGSMKFNGSSDYLSFPASQNFAMQAGNFTVEAWVYPTAFSAYRAIFDTRAATTNNTGMLLSLANASTGSWAFLKGSTLLITASTNLTLNTWQHVAVVRSGSTITLYLNGVSVGTATDAQSFTDTTCRVGATVDSIYWSGYIDDLRVTKGVARYLSNFTPPQIGMANQ